ncbi:hypothetical protein ACWGGS_13980 [Streptomyces decoyicus]
MGRRPSPLDPDDPLHAFAIELRALRDVAGSDGTFKATCARVGISRSTYFAWLGGKQLPGRDLLELVVESWGGDIAYWLERRRQAEQALEYLKVPSASPQEEVDAGGPYNDETVLSHRLKGGPDYTKLSELEDVGELSTQQRHADQEFLAQIQYLVSDMPSVPPPFLLRRHTDYSPEQVSDILAGTYYGSPEGKLHAREQVVKALEGFYPDREIGDAWPIGLRVQLCLKWAEVAKNLEKAWIQRSISQIPRRPAE